MKNHRSSFRDAPWAARADLGRRPGIHTPCRGYGVRARARARPGMTASLDGCQALSMIQVKSVGWVELTETTFGRHRWRNPSPQVPAADGFRKRSTHPTKNLSFVIPGCALVGESRLGAQARNPYSLQGLWIPRCAIAHRGSRKSAPRNDASFCGCDARYLICFGLKSRCTSTKTPREKRHEALPGHRFQRAACGGRCADAKTLGNPTADPGEGRRYLPHRSPYLALRLHSRPRSP